MSVPDISRQRVRKHAEKSNPSNRVPGTNCAECAVARANPSVGSARATSAPSVSQLAAASHLARPALKQTQTTRFHGPVCLISG
eukprot:2585191-Rhodomonas_salina.1